MRRCDAREVDALFEHVQSLRSGSSFTCIGIQGIQGCGKTTTCARVAERLASIGVRCATLSIDDFYLPREALGERVRGPPGTHDVRLLWSALARLRAGETDVEVPIYDKSVDGGRGDRTSETRSLGATQVVLLEGWCLGFAPTGASIYDAALSEWDDVYSQIDTLIILVAPSHFAYEWREAAEAERRRQGSDAMTVNEVIVFVDAYMPVYDAHLQNLYDSTKWPSVHHVHLTIQ